MEIIVKAEKTFRKQVGKEVIWNACILRTHKVFYCFCYYYIIAQYCSALCYNARNGTNHPYIFLTYLPCIWVYFSILHLCYSFRYMSYLSFQHLCVSRRRMTCHS